MAGKMVHFELPSKDTALLAMKMAESLEIKDNREADAIAYYERARKTAPELNDRCARRLAVLYDKVDNQSQAMIEFELEVGHPEHLIAPELRGLKAFAESAEEGDGIFATRHGDHEAGQVGGQSVQRIEAGSHLLAAVVAIARGRRFARQ